MLVLSRQRNQSIVIGNEGEFVITVVGIRGDKVRLCIEAPREIPVHRRKVYEAIKKHNLEDIEMNYRKFRKCLTDEDFEMAYNIFYDYKGEFGTRGEIDKMVYGYQSEL